MDSKAELDKLFTKQKLENEIYVLKETIKDFKKAHESLRVLMAPLKTALNMLQKRHELGWEEHHTINAITSCQKQLDKIDKRIK